MDTFHPEEEEDFTSSANQLGCTDVPGLSVTCYCAVRPAVLLSSLTYSARPPTHTQTEHTSTRLHHAYVLLDTHVHSKVPKP